MIRTFLQLAAAIGFVTTADACADRVELRSIMIDGELVQNACTDLSLEELNKTVTKQIGKTDKPEDLFAVIKNVLCTESTASIAGIFDRMKSVVLIRDSATGQSDQLIRKNRSTVLAASLARAGEAWKPDIGAERKGQAILSFNPNEACIQEIELVLERDRWLIVKATKACD